MSTPVTPSVQPPIVVPPLRLVYVPIPKCACSSLKLVFRRLLGMPDPEPWWKIHETVWPSANLKLPPIPDAELCLDLGWSMLAVVRNPWDRLWSVYKSKFHKERFNDLSQHHDQLALDMTFLQFVVALGGIDLSTANEHLRPQMNILRPWRDLVEPPRDANVLRFERLNRQWSALSFPKGPRFMPLPELPHLNREDGLDYRCVYTPSMEAIVGELYRPDVEGLGYAFSE